MQQSLSFFANNLTVWRKSMKKGQEELAEMLSSLEKHKSKRATLGHYETQRHSPSMDFVLEIAGMMQVSLDALFSRHLEFENGKLVGENILMDAETPATYQRLDKITEIQEKLDALWALNMHRAEKMEAWEVEIKALRSELDKAKAELEKLKGNKA